MMQRILCAVLSVALLSACSGWSSGNTTGTAVGAAAGAGIGVLAAGGSSVLGGAAIGLGVGALAGYLISEWVAEPEPAPGQPISPEQQARSDAQAYFRQAHFARNAADSEYYLKRSLELHATPAAHNNLGLLYLQHGDRPRAAEHWRKALELDPGNRVAQLNLQRLG